MKTCLFILMIGSLSLACSHLPKEASKTKYTSKLDVNSTKVMGFDVRKHTAAELRVVKLMHVPLSNEKTFELILDTMPKWSKDLESVTYFNDDKNIGYKGNPSATHRVCVFQGDRVTEIIPAYKEGSLFAYSIEPSRSSLNFPIENHLAVITVESDQKGGSLVTWRQYFDKKLHIMAPFVGIAIDGLLEDSMEGFTKLYGGTLLEPTSF